MECEVCTENGRGTAEAASKTVWQVEREPKVISGSFLLDVAGRVPRERSHQQMYVDLVVPQPPPSSSRTPELPALDLPFMSTMDEITYWIYTKRAPCLLNYDILAKKQQEEAHCSKTKPKSVASIPEDITSPKKKKKRKLSILDDDSVSEKQQNVYFDVSNQQNHKTVLSSCKLEPQSSDIDFNIKSASPQIKRKRLKLQKNSPTTLHKKNKVVTSTPKATKALRRSSRKAQQNLNNNSHFNSSFEVYNCSIVNGNGGASLKKPLTKALDRSKKVTEKVPDQITNKKNELAERPKNEVVLNGQFEDLSDVSGFTANYIRSTKKTPRKLRGKATRNLVKESQETKGDTMVICVNKSTNPGLSKPALNCSTDSSQNIVNLVTMENTEKSTKVSRGTSVLKFMESKTNKETLCRSKVDNKQSQSNLNVSFQSSGTSRYPKRYKNVSTEDLTLNSSSKKSPVKRRCNKNSSNFNSDRKENPDETSISKTRSGRSLGLALRQPENSVLVLSNTTDQMSSAISMNVATAATATTDNLKDNKKKRISKKCIRAKKTIDKSTHRTSLREKSGFSACFSDSDDDKPLKPQKFFC